MAVPTNLKPPFFIYGKHSDGNVGLFYIVRNKAPWSSSIVYTGHQLYGKSDNDLFEMYNKYQGGNYGFWKSALVDCRMATKEEIEKGKKILREFEDKRIIEAI